MDLLYKLKIVPSFLFVLLFTNGIITAQKNMWTLKACIDTGIQRNINLKQEQINNAVNAVNLEQSKENLYPSMGMTDAPGYSFGKTQSGATYISLNTSSNTFALTGNLTIYNGMQYQNTIRENNFIYQAGMQNVETTKNNLCLSILTGYLQVLAYYEGVEIAQSQIKTDSTQVEQTKIYVMAGKYPELNLLQIESQLASDKLAEVNAKNQLILSKVNLMQLMNMPVDYNFEVERPSQIDTFLSITALTSANIYSTAVGFLPQIKNAELSTQASEEGLKVSKALYYPKLSMNGSIRSSGSSLLNTENYQPGTIGYIESTPQIPVEGYVLETGYTNNTSNLWNQFNDNFNQFIGLTLSVPIFSNFIAKNSVAIAKLNIQNAQLNEESVKINLRQTIEQAYTNLLAAKQQYDASKEALKSETRTFSDMQNKYKVGLSTATDYLIEESNYTKALQNIAQAKYNYLLQVKLVDFYLGKPITF